MVPKGKGRKHWLAKIPSYVAGFIRLSRHTLSVWDPACLVWPIFSLSIVVPSLLICCYIGQDIRMSVK